MLFLDAGTKDFAYWCSEDRTWYNNWILVPLEFDIIQTDPVCKIHKKKCEIHHYKGTYLAFDYQVHEFDQLAQGQYLKSDYDPDGYYSNYILKISAARSYDVAPDYKKRRIMCEDLGTSNDFDFNDLVFDVYYTGTKDSESKYTANITVQAAGGTLPIYIGNVDNSNEVHYILEKQTSSGGKYTPIINKGGNRTEIDIKIEGLETTNPDDIKIYVGDKENPAGKTVQLPKSEKGQYEQDGSPAPQKICLPFGTPWTDENQQIETLLLDFRDWVQDHTIDAWWKDNLNSSDDSDTSGGEEDNEGFWEDIDFTWVDGVTYKEVNITQGNFEKCVFYGQGSAVDVEYDEDIVDIELNTKSSILYVIGKAAGETTIKVTQKSTGKTLTLNVTVEEGSGDGTTTADRPTYTYTISSTGIDITKDETTIFVDKEFTITVDENKLKKECGFSFDAGGTGTTYEKNYNDDGITTFKFKVGDVKGTVTFTISLDGYQDGNTIYNPVEKKIKIHVIEPEGTKLTPKTIEDEGKKMTFNVSDLSDLLEEEGTTSLTFTVLFAKPTYYFSFTANGKEGQSLNPTAATTEYITISKDWFDDIDTFDVNCGDGIIAVYVQSTSSAKKRTIRRR